MIAAVSTRITEELKYHEIRDSISHDLINNLESNGFLPVLIPNSEIRPEQYYKKIKFNLFILSGGDNLIFENKITSINKEKQKRDIVEKKFLKFCISKNIPVIGICRGMQLINVYFDGSLTLLNNKTHNNGLHNIKIERFAKTIFPNSFLFVNSFHNNVVLENDISNQLIPFMYAEDDSIEALVHKKYPILGVMFHPERSFNNNPIDHYLNNAFYKNILNYLKGRE